MTAKQASQKLQGWFAGALPDDWFTGGPEVTVDNDEVLVIGHLPEPDVGKEASDDARREAEASRISNQILSEVHDNK